MLVGSKLMVARALLLSKGLLSAGTWPTLNASEQKRLHQALVKVFGGCMFSGWHDKMYSFALACQEHQLSAPIHLVRQLRLGLFRRVCERAPVDLLPLLVSGFRAKRSCFAAVLEDIRLFHESFLCGLVLQLIRYCRLSVAEIVTTSSFLPELYRALSADRLLQHGIKLTCRDKLTETHSLVCLNEFHPCQPHLQVGFWKTIMVLCHLSSSLRQQQDREFRNL